MRHLAIVLLLLPLAGCTGLTMGENDPGEDTWLEAGSIAVDPVTENAFVLSTIDTAETHQRVKTLYAVGPDSGRARQVMDLSPYHDIRILFPRDRVMLMTQGFDFEVLRLLDPVSLEEVKRKEVDARYAGTRLAPSGDFLAVADNGSDSAPIHLIETDGLEVHEIPHDGDWLEAMWLTGEDTLLAVIFYDMGEPTARARLLSWDVAALAADGFPVDANGLWAQPSRDLTVEGAEGDLLFSYTWVGVSPTDAYAVIPVRHRAEGEAQLTHRLLVWNLGANAVEIVDDARGPVGFTPDGTTIVSYRYIEEDNGHTAPRLLMVDAVDLAEELVELPGIDLPQFFVTRDGNFVVVASSLGGSQLVLFDASTGEQTELRGPGITLNEFVSRSPQGELWLVDLDELYRLDLFAAELSEVALDWSPAHINILRQRDLLILDDRAANRLVFYDPVALAVVRSASLK